MDEANSIPVILKGDSSIKEDISQRREMLDKLNENGKNEAQQDIYKLETGLKGEDSIIDELRYSFTVPMYILRDVYYEVGGRTAQIDFLVFTRKFCLVIECKNNTGNIEITGDGVFIHANGSTRKGLYSPITQNKRHTELLKQLETERIGVSNPHLNNIFKSLIVFANDETILHKENAPDEMRSQVIRRDQLVEYIEHEYRNAKNPELTEQQTKEWAEWYFNRHNKTRTDYTWKYNKYLEKEVVTEGEKEPDSDKDLRDTLKEYRNKKAKEDGIYTYEIFLDKHREVFIKCKPENRVDLLKAYARGIVEQQSSDERKIKAWFDNVSKAVDKYGDDILDIIAKHTNRNADA